MVDLLIKYFQSWVQFLAAHTHTHTHSFISTVVNLFTGEIQFIFLTIFYRLRTVAIIDIIYIVLPDFL